MTGPNDGEDVEAGEAPSGDTLEPEEVDDIERQVAAFQTANDNRLPDPEVNN